ncbi:MAG: hypothetical protein QM755_23815 [Luteolibacter sp.]
MNHNRNVTDAADAVTLPLERLAKLIEEASEGDGCQTDARRATEPPVSLVREANGWGKKYVFPITLTGDRWLAMFAQAKAEIAAHGIVAFLGDRGPGKTQMAAEIARDGEWPDDAVYLIRHGDASYKQTSKTALYRRAMDVFLDLRATNKKDATTSEKDVLRRLEEVGLLVIDEFQERGQSDWEDRIITNLIDKRYAAERPTILIANYTREEMSAALSPSVRDRMHEAGRSFVFDWSSYRRSRP